MAGSCEHGGKRFEERGSACHLPKTLHEEARCRGKGVALEATEPPAVCLWASDCTSLSLGLLICKMEIILEPALQPRFASQKCSEGTEDRMRKYKRKRPAQCSTRIAQAACEVQGLVIKGDLVKRGE